MNDAIPTRPDPAVTVYPTVGSARPAAGPPEWITLAAAARLLRRHVNAVKSIALARGIRFQILPWARILYNRSDCERLAAAG